MANQDDRLTKGDLRHMAKSDGLTLKPANIAQIADSLRAMRAGVMRKDGMLAAHTPLAICIEAEGEGRR
jgi:hypothetical protein